MGIKKPPSYEHPSKRKGQGSKNEPPASARAETAEIPKRKKEETSETTVPIRLVIAPPKFGQIPIYDQMIEAGFTPNKAVLGLLKKGFPRFESDLLGGKIEVKTGHLETEGNPVDTTRNVSLSFHEAARKLFDPFEVLSDRALGQSIAEAILCSVSKVSRNGR